MTSTSIHSVPSRIIVAMSGGVDSSVAAYLLKKAGHQVEAVFMKNWEGDDTDTYCSAAKDMADAQAICDQLDIDFHMVNFANQYWERVFTYFLEEYQAARTPNPDILCNKEIKFKAFLDYAKNRGADFIATGHYVRTEQKSDQTYLLKGFDTQKDQSYFLSTLDQSQLAKSIFPIGNLSKLQVRAIAKQLGFENYAKKDSTGICFIGERKFKTFLNGYLPSKPGNIETSQGEVIGSHDGLMFYTIGQRQGLQIGGKKGKAESPWYIADKDIKRNVLIAVQGIHHPALYKKSLIASSLHWIQAPPKLPIKLSAKTRYRQVDQVCVIEPINPLHYRITFEQPQRALTPGQAIVFYQDEVCLGGGIITTFPHLANELQDTIF